MSMTRFRPIVAASLAALLMAAAPQPAPPTPDAPVPHRAIYDIGLADAGEGSSVTSADGRMVFEVTGSACDGYTMSQRLVVRLSDGEGDDRVLDFRVSTFEAGDGALYRFVSRTYLNDKVIEDVKGVAERTPKGIAVKVENPQQKTVRMDKPILFPSQHLQAILAAARTDQRFLSHEIYEGAGTGERADTATAFIGSPQRGAAEEAMTSGKTRWPVSIAYFNKEEKNDDALGEETPSYQMRFDLYENGITRNLVMDYGDYALSGTLKTIEPLEVTGCLRTP